MSYLPVIDESLCLAHGDCALLAPHVFSVEDVAMVVGEGTDEELLESAQACPAGAISLLNRDTDEQVYP